MTDDRTFQLILILGFAVVMPVGLYHRLRARASGEKLDRRQEGLFILFTLRPIAATSILATFAFVINPAWMAWSSVPLHLSVRWMGVCMGIAGGMLLIWTFRSLGKNITDTVVTRKDHTLITSGPYRFVRHPFYVAAGLAIAANSLTVANWFLAVTGAIAFALIVLRTTKEEENLVKRFGDDYRTYMQTAGRFVPRFSSLRR